MTLLGLHALLGHGQTFPPQAPNDRPSNVPLPPPVFTSPQATDDFVLPPVPADTTAETLQKTPAADATQLFVSGFRFRGHTVFDESQLQTIAQPYSARALTAADLEQLRHEVTRLYLEHGYINSGAVLPQQTVQDGVVEFQIIEGRLSNIEVTSDGLLDPEYVRDRLALASGPPLDQHALQQRYQLLLTDPNIERLHGQLRPGLKLGQSVLDVRVSTAKSYGVSLSFDNFRPPSTGAEQINLESWYRNLLGYGDLYTLSLGYGEDRLNIAASFSIPVNRYDTVWGFHYARQHSSVLEEPLNDLNIDNSFETFETYLQHPFYLDLYRRINIGIRATLRQSHNRLLGRDFSFSAGEENGRSTVTALRLTQEIIDSRENQILMFRSTFNTGINAFNATWHQDGRPDGDYFSWLGQFQYARKISDNGGQIRFQAATQLASEALLPLEQFALGGVHSVRGYRENELVRDQGYLLSLEYHYPLFQYDQDTLIPGNWKLIPFMDYGTAWNTGERGRSLHGIGVGLNWTLPRIRAELVYAHSLIAAGAKPEYDLQDASLYFRLSAELL